MFASVLFVFMGFILGFNLVLEFITEIAKEDIKKLCEYIQAHRKKLTFDQDEL